MMAGALPNVINYVQAMEIVNKGKYHNATKNLLCDYCMASYLSGSWKLLINDDIDLCMKCFITLRNGMANGQTSLPVSGTINNILPNLDAMTMTYMMQDSVRNENNDYIMTQMLQDSARKPDIIPRYAVTRMQQDSVRKPDIIPIYAMTKMQQDSVRKPDLIPRYTMTKMQQDSVRKQNNNNDDDNIECFSRNSNLKYSLYNN